MLQAADTLLARTAEPEGEQGIRTAVQCLAMPNPFLFGI